MKIINAVTKWLRNLFFKEITDQAYQDDQRYKYILVFEKGVLKYSFAYRTAVPLQSGHQIVLGRNAVFTCDSISHITYPKEISNNLSRDSVIVHAAVSLTQGTAYDDEVLRSLAFNVEVAIENYTIH